jgi:Coenzyme PQQ synthesis protein D (PqqD)
MAARRIEGVQIERTADEILVLKEGSLEAHAINQSAAVVYDLCDGNTSKSEMAAAIHRHTGLPADEEIVDLALSELVETGLVMLDDPESLSTGTRRALIRRLALSSTLALILPVVETVVVPPESEAQSISPRRHIPAPTPTPVRN